MTLTAAIRRVALAVALVGAIATAAYAAQRTGPAKEFRAVTAMSVTPTTSGPLALVRIEVGQVGRDIEFAARTTGRWSAADLARSRQRSICLLISSAPSAPPARQLCLRAGRRTRALSLGVARAGTTRFRPTGARVARSDAYSFVATVDPAAAGVTGRYAWRVESTWSGGPCASPCTDVQPTSAPVAATLTPVRPVACTRPGELFVTRGITSGRMVALTFDDGPAHDTPQILSELEHAHVNATFFLIGRQIAGKQALVRRELRDGDVVGDHTFTHPNVSAGGSFAQTQLSSTVSAIEAASGFRPCLFRAPYGAVSGALEAVANSLGMTTIQWNVDPRDWSRPGTGAIISNVLTNVRPGSIVIMHDGPALRDETAAAVPRIIAGLRARGYSFDTVPALLGQSVIYGR